MTPAPRCPNPDCGGHMVHARLIVNEQTREVWRCVNPSCRRDVPISAWKPLNHWAEAREREGWC